MQSSRRHAGICVFCAHSSVSQLRPRPVTLSRAVSTRPQLGLRQSLLDKSNDDLPFRIRAHPSGKGSTAPRETNHYRQDRAAQRQPKIAFNDLLKERLEVAERELKDAPIVDHLSDDGRRIGFRHVWKAFTQKIFQPKQPEAHSHLGQETRQTYMGLRKAYQERGASGLDDRIRYAFYGLVTGARFTDVDIKNQKALADLRYPIEWYPATRSMHRTIHLHVGPTNSGKTYHALKRLEAAESGVYAGPLRLLAHEVYTRLNAKGKRCTLITGEERRSPDDSLMSNMSSCTVEMMPLNKSVDVAVIDEIQMIGNAERGWAWTQALLGVKAKEVHLCGEARTVPLIRELCASIGEKIVVHEYERLSPLAMAQSSLDGNLKKLRKGDCIVSFSVVGIHALRRQIERETGKKVATVYGSLPPETRAQQARLFNDPNNDYDYLVASDAIGMGLNLSIKRIIFETSTKFDGTARRPLAVADIKQIAGRAGRYRSAHQDNLASQAEQDLSVAKGENAANVEGLNVDDQVAPADSAKSTETQESEESASVVAESPTQAVIEDSENDQTYSAVESGPEMQEAASLDEQAETNPTSEEGTDAFSARAPKHTGSTGLVTTLETFDYPFVKAAMGAEPEPIRTAGIFPPAPIVERFAQYFPPGTPFSFVMLRLHELSQMHTRFHLCGLRDQLWVADLIEPVRNLTISDRIILCACPASKQDINLFSGLLPALARCIEQQGGGNVLDIMEMPLEVLEKQLSPSREYLRELEQLHKGLIAYLWLSYRFAGIFTTRPLAFHVKTLVEEKIEQVLSGFSFTEKERRSIQAKREKSVWNALRLDEETAAVAKSEEEELARQTSVVAGGDRFSGEGDVLITEPIEEDGSDEPTGLNHDLPPKTAQAEEHDAAVSEEQSPHDAIPDTQAGGLEALEEGLATVPDGHDEETELSKEDTPTKTLHKEGNVGLDGSEMPKHLHQVESADTEQRDVSSRP